MLAWHLAWRYLRRRRMAWLAIAAVTLTVMVSVLVVGVVQGWLEVTEAQVRASESDVTVLPRSRDALVHPGPLQSRLAALDGVAGVAPFIEATAQLIPRRGGGREDALHGIGVKIDGIDFDADMVIDRMQTRLLHATPTLDLKLPPIPVEERGSGFISSDARAWLALSGLDLVAPLAGVPLERPPPPHLPFRPGVILGRELIFVHYGNLGLLAPGRTVTLIIPDAKGGALGRVNAEVTDTMGTGVYEIDRWAAVAPLPIAQRLTAMDGRYHGRRGVREVRGYHVAAAPGADPHDLAQRIANEVDPPNLLALHWTQLRGHLVRNLRVQRNIIGLVMILIGMISIFIIYAVFSSLVAEKRKDIGVLLGLGASRASIVCTFVAAGLCTSLLGGVLGWGLGWAGLALLNPVGEAIGFPLFPQELFFTAAAPISYNPLIPAFYIGLMLVVGLVSSLLPAWKAGRIDPIASLRDLD